MQLSIKLNINWDDFEKWTMELENMLIANEREKGKLITVNAHYGGLKVKITHGKTRRR